MEHRTHTFSAQTRDLGGFTVGRVIPQIGCKTVGPFVFFDHMGPVHFAAGEGIDVRPHPHIGLATVTFLFEGAILHRDSLGSEQVIKPGDINWMTAGSGIVHSERTPLEIRRTGGPMEGIQCWVALPREWEETEPQFHHHPARDLPRFQKDGVSFQLLLGSVLGHSSPVRTYSDTIYLEAKMPEGSRVAIPAEGAELGVYVISGALRVNGETTEAKQLTVGRQGLVLEAASSCHLMIIGGEPLPEKREVWWNFVSSSKERIEAAKAAWKAGSFPRVPGDDKEFIPLPQT